MGKLIIILAQLTAGNIYPFNRLFYLYKIYPKKNGPNWAIS